MSLAAAAWLACAESAFAESVTLFRVFLNDGLFLTPAQIQTTATTVDKAMVAG